MNYVEDVWRLKSDDELQQAAACLVEYTHEGEKAIRAELRRRGLAEPPEVERQPVVEGDPSPPFKSRECVVVLSVVAFAFLGVAMYYTAGIPRGSSEMQRRLIEVVWGMPDRMQEAARVRAASLSLLLSFLAGLAIFIRRWRSAEPFFVFGVIAWAVAWVWSALVSELSVVTAVSGVIAALIVTGTHVALRSGARR